MFIPEDLGFGLEGFIKNEMFRTFFPTVHNKELFETLITLNIPISIG